MRYSAQTACDVSAMEAVVENENDDVILASGELKRVNLADEGRDDDCICLDIND